MPIDKLDKEMADIQKSTRTTLGFMSPIHNKLRAKFAWYYQWHLWPYFKTVQIVVLILFIAFSSLILANYISREAKRTHAATTNLNLNAGKKGFYSAVTGKPTPPAGTDFTAGENTQIGSQDDDDVYTDTTVVTATPYHMFQYYTTQTGITDITGFSRGWGLNNDENGYYYVYIYNYNSSSWVELNHHTGLSNSNISNSVSSLADTDTSHYISSGYIYVMAIGGQAIDSDRWAEVHTDYSYVTITHAAEPPAAPSNATITSISTTGFTAGWTDNSSDESGFKVYISTTAADSCSGATYPGSPDYTTAANAVSQAVSGKAVNTRYCLKVTAYNAYGDSSAVYSSPSYTLANIPSAPTIDSTSDTSISVIINQNSNPTGTTYAIRETSTNEYVQADGTLDATTVWQNYSTWGGASGITVTGLSPNTPYTFEVKARNSDSTPTAFSSIASVYTLASVPSAMTVENTPSDNPTTKLKVTIPSGDGNPTLPGTTYWPTSTNSAAWPGGEYEDTCSVPPPGVPPYGTAASEQNRIDASVLDEARWMTSSSRLEECWPYQMYRFVVTEENIDSLTVSVKGWNSCTAYQWLYIWNINTSTWDKIDEEPPVLDPPFSDAQATATVSPTDYIDDDNYVYITITEPTDAGHLGCPGADAMLYTNEAYITANHQATEYAVYEAATGKYLQADGTLGASAVWQTRATWGGDSGITVTGLSANTNYTFQAKARNNDDEESELSTGSSRYTYIQTPTGISFVATNTTIAATATGTISNITAGQSGLQFAETTGHSGGGGQNGFSDATPPANWIQALSATDTGLAELTQYTYTVKARNGDGVETAATIGYSQTTLLNHAPNAPTSLGPAIFVDGSWQTDNTPTLTFALSDPDAEDTVKYNIQISTNSTFSSLVVDYTSALSAQGAASFTVGQTAGSGNYATGSAGQTLSDGSYYWRVKAIDLYSAESAFSVAGQSGADDIKIDLVAPVVDIYADPTQPNGSSGYYKTAAAITLGATDATSGVAGIYYRWEITNSFSLYGSGFNAPEGIHTIYYYAVDNTGNTTATYSREFKVDTTTPDVGISAVDRALVNTSVAYAPDVFPDSTPIDTYTYAWNFADGSTSVQSLPSHTFTVTGIYTVSLVSTSVSGNSYTATRQIAIIPPPPVVESVEYINNSYVFVGTSEAIGTINLTIGPDNIRLSGQTDDQGNWVISYSSALAEGDYFAFATVTDLNSMISDSSNEISFTVVLPEEEDEDEEDIIERVEEFISDLPTSVIDNFNPAVGAVATPLAVATIAVGLAQAAGVINMASSGLGVASVGWNLYSWILAGLEALGARRRRHPWGVVYDAISKQPVPLSIVRIYNKETNKLIETSVTDQEGRFGFLVEPGKYFIKVEKSGYRWSSRIVMPGTKFDDIYANIYHGGPFKVYSKNSVVNFSIPTDPVHRVQDLRSPFHKLQVFIKTYFLWILIPTLLIIIYSIFVLRNLYDIISLVLLFALLVREILDLRKGYHWGSVYDAVTKRPLFKVDLALVSSENNSVKGQKMSDKFGRFGFIVPPGRYKVVPIKSGYAFPSEKVKHKNDGKFRAVYHGEVIQKGPNDSFVSLNIPMDPVKKDK